MILGLGTMKDVICKVGKIGKKVTDYLVILCQLISALIVWESILVVSKIILKYQRLMRHHICTLLSNGPGEK